MFSKHVRNNKIKKKSTIICSFVLFVSSSFSTTFTSIFQSISSKCSHFSIATFNITSKSMKKLSINSFTFSISFFRTFVLKHQKFYLIIDNLIRMFHKKFESFDLSSHQKTSFFFAKHRCSIICHISISYHRLFFVCNQSKNVD